MHLFFVTATCTSFHLTTRRRDNPVSIRFDHIAYTRLLALFSAAHFYPPLITSPPTLVTQQTPLTSPTNSQLHKMIHKRLQANIIRENSLRRLTDPAIALARMRRTGVQLTQQETCLTTPGITHDKPGEREAVLDEVLGVFLGRLKQRREVLIAFLVLVACFAPLCHGFAVEDEDVEEGVEEEVGFLLDRGRVEEHRLAAFVVEALAVD